MRACVRASVVVVVVVVSRLARMAEFLIAGNVESVSFTHGERLCDILKKTLPVCTVTKMVALRNCWSKAKEEIAEKYGFESDRIAELECIVWFSDGRLIGSADEFSDYCKQTYHVQSDLELVDLPGIAKENTAVVQKMMEKATNGQVLFDVAADNGVLYE